MRNQQVQASAGMSPAWDESDGPMQQLARVEDLMFAGELSDEQLVELNDMETDLYWLGPAYQGVLHILREQKRG